jgi:tRNA pseudouridine55 synthase
MTASGFLLFDKPAGRTSFTALGGFRKAFPGARVGHTGTLDSFATGLLVVVVGIYSRLTPWFVGLDKVYQAEVRFGIGTDTLDPSGSITCSGRIPSRSAIDDVLPAFRGAITQVPPDYSAIHVEGRRASELARKGEPVNLASRPVTIFSLQLQSIEDDKAFLTIHCSSGTYIRALARDIAAACGTCAHVSALRRVNVGPFSVVDAISSPEQVTARMLHRFDPETAAFLGLGIGSIREELEDAFMNGAPSALHAVASVPAGDGDTAIFTSGRKFLGIMENRSGHLGYKLVLPKGGEEG